MSSSNTHSPSGSITQQDPRNINTLINVMRMLRNPDTGCPWDLEQDFSSIAPYTIEEAYEVADAIARHDKQDLKEELGDLLFQTIFYAQMGSEENSFTFEDIVEAITLKMIRRHPHVFGHDSQRDAKQQTIAWEEMKANERNQKGQTGLTDDVPVGLPGMTRAVKLQKRAARIGFDWPNATSVLDKIQEETQELVDAMEQENQNHIEDEFGDLLFVLANLSRHLNVDPEKALRRANQKFITRFQYVEERYNETFKQTDGQTNSKKRPSLDLMESWWQDAKRRER